MDTEKVKLEVMMCMGSACFARGNNENLTLLERMKDNGLDVDIDISGARCEEKCELGPHIAINGQAYSEVTPEKLETIIKSFYN